MSKRTQHHPEFKAKVALEAMKGKETVSELASRCGVRPTKALLEGASGVFGCGGRKRSAMPFLHRISYILFVSLC